MGRLGAASFAETAQLTYTWKHLLMLKLLLTFAVKTALGPHEPKLADNWRQADKEWELRLLRYWIFIGKKKFKHCALIGQTDKEWELRPLRYWILIGQKKYNNCPLIRQTYKEWELRLLRYRILIGQKKYKNCPLIGQADKEWELSTTATQVLNLYWSQAV